MRTPTLLLFLAACNINPGDPPAERSPFKDASAEQRSQAADLAVGELTSLAALAVLAAELDAIESDNTCPTATLVDAEASVVRYEASDCEGPSGTRYDGVVEATNLSWTSELTGPMALAFEDFTLDQDDRTLRFHGDVAQTEVDPAADATTTTALTVDFDGVTHGVWATVDCGWDGFGRMCSLQPGATGSIEGIGDFGLAGSYDLFGLRGTVFLDARDELIVDFSETDDDHCAPMHIETEEAGAYCFEPLNLPEPTRDSGLMSYLWGCEAGEEAVWFFNAETFGEGVAEIRLHIAPHDGHAIETHPFVVSDTNPTLWLLSIDADSDYVPGEGTELACPGEPGLVYEALDAYGRRIDCMAAGDPTGLDVTGCR